MTDVRVERGDVTAPLNSDEYVSATVPCVKCGGRQITEVRSQLGEITRFVGGRELHALLDAHC